MWIHTEHSQDTRKRDRRSWMEYTTKYTWRYLKHRQWHVLGRRLRLSTEDKEIKTKISFHGGDVLSKLRVIVNPVLHIWGSRCKFNIHTDLLPLSLLLPTKPPRFARTAKILIITPHLGLDGECCSVFFCLFQPSYLKFWLDLLCFQKSNREERWQMKLLVAPSTDARVLAAQTPRRHLKRQLGANDCDLILLCRACLLEGSIMHRDYLCFSCRPNALPSASSKKPGPPSLLTYPGHKWQRYQNRWALFAGFHLVFKSLKESSKDMFLCRLKYTEEKKGLSFHPFVISLFVLPLQKKDHEVIPQFFWPPNTHCNLLNLMSSS